MVKPVLVTSAAGGRQGKTGRHVSEMLLVARRSRPRLRAQDRRTLGAAARARRRDLRGRLPQHPLGAARGRGHVRDLFRLSGAGRADGRDRGDGAGRARSRRHPSGQSGDAAILARRADAADAAELSVRAGVRMGQYRRGAYPRHRVLRKSRLAGAPEPAGAGRDPPALGQREHRAAAGRRRGRRARRGRPVDRPAAGRRQLPPADRHHDFAEGDHRDLRPRDGQERALRGDFRRAMAPRRRPRAASIRTRSSISPRCGARSAVRRSIRTIRATRSPMRSRRSAAPNRRRSRRSCAKARASCWRNRPDRGMLPTYRAAQGEERHAVAVHHRRISRRACAGLCRARHQRGAPAPPEPRGVRRRRQPGAAQRDPRACAFRRIRADHRADGGDAGNVGACPPGACIS